MKGQQLVPPCPEGQRGRRVALADKLHEVVECFFAGCFALGFTQRLEAQVEVRSVALADRIAQVRMRVHQAFLL